MKVGIIREYKVPQDYRVPLTPIQASRVNEMGEFEVVIEASPDRCYRDKEYVSEGVRVVKELEDRDVLLGVKEVPVGRLIPGKTYFFFSHTIKEQEHNRELLKAILENRIRLIDYEVLTDEGGHRVIAFGKYAGMVGAHNALMTYGARTGAFGLPRMRSLHDYAEARALYKKLKLPAIKIVLTGAGRVGTGAVMVLQDMGILQVSPADFLSQSFDRPVFTQLDSPDYVELPGSGEFDRDHYYAHPAAYQSKFAPYTRRADIMINGIYWDNRAPAFFSAEDMKRSDFRLQVIADVTCDIAPASSIPSTLRASTIEEPVYGYDPLSGRETDPYQPASIDVMAIDNLPNELPRDASEAFGEQFIRSVLPELKKEKSEMLERATVAVDGELGPHFRYLEEYVSGDR